MNYMNKAEELMEKKELFETEEYRDIGEALKKLMVFIKECIAKETNLLLFLKRKDNHINYGIKSNGYDYKIIDSDTIGSIEVLTEYDFYNLYKYLKDEYFSNFPIELVNISGHGWILFPSVSNKVSFQIDSDNSFDNNWIYEEVYNVKNNSKTI